MKKILTIFLLAVMSLVMAVTATACKIGDNSGSNDDIGDLTEKEGKITIWWPGSSVQMKTIEEAKKDYEAENPGVEIEIIGQSTADFYSAYMLACAGSSAPDIAYVDHVYIQTLAYYGYIANLSSAGMDEYEDKFISSLWAPNMYEDKLYAMPMSANVLATAYNKTLIARAQNTTVDNIQLPKNYEQLVTLCQQIIALNTDSSVEPYYGITLPAGTGNTSMAAMSYLSFVNRSGGNGILSEDLRTSLVNSSASIDAALKLYDLGQYSTQTFSEAKFESGHVGMIEIGPWKIADYEKYSSNYEWELGFTTSIPFTEGGDKSGTLGLYSMVVTKNENSALAADFVKFLTTNDKYQLMFAKSQNLLPCTVAALEDEFYEGEAWDVFIEQLNNVAVRPGSPAWTDIEDVLGSFVTKLVQRSYADEAAVRQACIGINSQVEAALEDIYS